MRSTYSEHVSTGVGTIDMAFDPNRPFTDVPNLPPRKPCATAVRSQRRTSGEPATLSTRRSPPGGRPDGQCPTQRQRRQGAGPTAHHPAPNRPPEQPPERRAGTRDKGAMRLESVFPGGGTSPAGAMRRGFQQPHIGRPRQRQRLGGIFRRREPGAPDGQGGATAPAHLPATAQHVDIFSLHRHVGVSCR